MNDDLPEAKQECSPERQAAGHEAKSDNSESKPERKIEQQNEVAIDKIGDKPDQFDIRSEQVEDQRRLAQ